MFPLLYKSRHSFNKKLRNRIIVDLKSLYQALTRCKQAILKLILDFLVLDLFQIEAKRGAAKYCGKHLANALHLVCGGVYFVPEWSKKSVPGKSNSLIKLQIKS